MQTLLHGTDTHKSDSEKKSKFDEMVCLSISRVSKKNDRILYHNNTHTLSLKKPIYKKDLPFAFPSVLSLTFTHAYE